MDGIVCKRCQGTDYVKKRNGSKSATLPMQGLRLQFHEYAAARQAAGNEGFWR